MKIKLDTYDWLPDVMEANNNAHLEAFAGAPRYESEEYTDGCGVARRGEYSIDFPDGGDSLEILFPEHDPNEDNPIPVFFQVKREYETDGKQSTTRTVEFRFSLGGVKWEGKNVLVSYMCEWEEVV